MSVASMVSRWAAVGDSFLPTGLTDPAEIRKTRAAILGSGMGFVCSTLTALSYGLMGSPWSGFAIGLISLGLVSAPFIIRRGVSSESVANAMLGVTYVATYLTASRSGGFASPSMAWAFVFPSMAYVGCSWRSVVAWVGLSVVLLTTFFAAERAGVTFPQDFSPAVLSILRATGHALVIGSTMAALAIVESVRQAAQRALDAANQALERERILGDMHDGLGSQLLGLIHQARSNDADLERWLPPLESCFDDLRIIVDSLDPIERPLETALGELRSRFQPRCEAAGIELSWRCEVEGLTQWSSSDTVQLMRTLQELLTNALRHSRARHIEVSAIVEKEPRPALTLTVRDDGVGFDSAHPPRVGRGLKSLASRARKLRGSLVIESGAPGTRAVVTCSSLQPTPNLRE